MDEMLLNNEKKNNQNSKNFKPVIENVIAIQE
jgi:hypothetical protein